MTHDEAKIPSNIVTEQIVIETKYNTRLIPVTAEKDSIDEINKALETAKKEHELLDLYRLQQEFKERYNTQVRVLDRQKTLNDIREIAEEIYLKEKEIEEMK